MTGDGNVVMSIADTAALNALLDRLHPSRLRQLPSEVSDFQGRVEEERELVDQLRGTHGRPSGLSAIGGMGGTGKTALAVRVARQLAGDYPDAQLFIDLKGVTEPLSPQDALERLIHSFNPEMQLPERLEEVQTIYRSLLAQRRAIVVLDNARDAEQVMPLLPPAPSMAIVTSRRSILLPGTVSKTLGKLDFGASRALLRELVPSQQRASDNDLDELAERCGHLPLALRAAGTFVAVNSDWSIAEYLAELAKTRRRLKGPDDQSLDVLTILGSSATQLRKENSALADRWCQLQVFPADFDREAAAAVWKVNADETRDQLSQLIRWTMLEHDASSKRYRLHDLMRDVASTEAKANHLQEFVSQAAIRHARHYLSVLEMANQLYKSGHAKINDGLSLYDREAANIANGQALACAFAKKEGALARLASDYASAGVYVMSLRLHPHRRIALLEAALASSRTSGDRQQEGNHLGNLGNVYSDLGNTRRTIVYYEQALAIAREIGDRRSEGSSLGNLGTAYAKLGQTRKAIDYHEQALAIAYEVGDRRGEGTELGNLGNAYAQLGETRKAIVNYKHALVIAREIGDRHGEGNYLGNLGSAYSRLGETRRAIDHHEQALAIACEIGDRQHEGNELGNLANAHAQLGETRKAIVNYGQALAIAREIGDRRGEGISLGNLGKAYSKLGETRRAIDHHEQALAIARETGDRRGEGTSLSGLGIAHAQFGETRKAIVHNEQALAIAREVGDRRGEGTSLGNLGNSYAMLGETRKAIDHFEQALAIVREVGDRRYEGTSLGNLGNSYAMLGETRKAIDHHEQALAIAREVGNRPGEGNVLGNLGNSYARLGETRKAIDHLEQALVIAREVGDRPGEGNVLGNLGNSYARLGETRKAIVCYEQAIAIAREIGNRGFEGVHLSNLSHAYAILGDIRKGDRTP